MNNQVLIVEDSPSLARTYEAYLLSDGFQVKIAETGAQAISDLQSARFDVVVLDVQLPDMSGLDILQSMRKSVRPAEAVIITANGSVNLAVDAMRAGAFDFIVKPFNAKRLQLAVRNALKSAAREAEAKPAQQAGAQAGDQAGDDAAPIRMVSQAPSMQSVMATIRNTARSNATVFITGESGTGKEVCAHTLHHMSPRAKAPLVTLNCAAIPKDLLESEIFGHAKGAFTGATSDREGAAMRADGGTLFLDEICEMDISLQAKLLRFLQTKTVQRLGEDKLRECDVRFVCATNRNPLEEVRAGRFREDLFYRLFVIPVHLPPLRDRVEDIVPLAQFFLATFAREDAKSFTGFSDAAREALRGYRWPGNVRQLENTIRNAVVLNDGPLVDAAMLQMHAYSLIAEGLSGSRDPAASARSMAAFASHSGHIGQPAQQPAIPPLEDTITNAIKAALKAADGSVPRAAEMLKVSPSTLYRRMENWGPSAEDGGN